MQHIKWLYSTNLTVFSVLYSILLDQLIYISVLTYFNKATFDYLNNSEVVKMLNDCECYYFRLNNNIRGEQKLYICLLPLQHFPLRQWIFHRGSNEKPLSPFAVEITSFSVCVTEPYTIRHYIYKTMINWCKT